MMNTAMSNLPAIEAVIQDGLRDTAPAITLAVYRQGERLLHGAYGALDPAADSPACVQTDTLFDLASLTKLYTSTAFLLQVSAGKVSLDTPVIAVLPEFGAGGLRSVGPQQDPHTLQLLPPESDDPRLVDPASITFRHLLTHTSGLPPWRDLFLRIGPTPPPPDQPDPLPAADRLARGLALIAETPFAGQPGDAVRYSDLGLILLGAAVARLKGTGSLATAIEALLLHPAGLTETLFNPDPAFWEAGIAPTELDLRWRGRRCLGEVHDENACALGGVAGHAGLFATADAVARFGMWWLDALDGRTTLRRDLAEDAVRLHAETGLERRGLGWMLRTPGYSSSGAHFSAGSFGHTGFTGTSLWIDPERALVVALLTNRVYHGRDADGIIALRKALHDAVALYVDTL